MMGLNPYVVFNGNCEEALNFYQKALGGEMQIMRYSEAPASPDMPPIPDELKNKVLHSFFKSEGIFMMASDAFPGQESTPGTAISLSIGLSDAAQGGKIYNALVQGGKAVMPYAETFWSKGYGILVDKYGISWMINVEDPKNRQQHEGCDCGHEH